MKVEFGEDEEKVPLNKIVERAKQYQPVPRVTYKMIQEYIEDKYGFKVHTAYIAEVKSSGDKRCICTFWSDLRMEESKFQIAKRISLLNQRSYLLFV